MNNNRLVELLINKGYKISCAESCTGGMLASSIVDVANASKVMDMSFVTYADLAKVELLNVKQETIDTFGVVSEEVAKDILKLQVNKVVNNFKLEKQITLTLSDNAFNTLYEKATHNLEDGGRGIGNAVETYLINPLSNYVFDTYQENKTNVHIEEINVISEDDVKLICK